MKKTDDSDIFSKYFELLNQQKFVPENLDYSILEKHKPLLQQLATIGNSGVSVFDLYKKEYVFYSPNFSRVLGYGSAKMDKEHTFYNSKVHQDDAFGLTKNAITLLKLFYQFSWDEKANYKLINEFRMENADGKYIRVIEQHQILEFDIHGNLWLALSTTDISPNQSMNEGLKSQLLNFRTGKIIPFKAEERSGKEEPGIALTNREKQILQLVKDGLLSKEISDKLAISVHTVNTHRQRFLEKLGANNSMEAVVFASRLGLL